MRKTTGCADMCGKRLKCEYVRETAKSAILHPPHLIVASETNILDIGRFRNANGGTAFGRGRFCSFILLTKRYI